MANCISGLRANTAGCDHWAFKCDGCPRKGARKYYTPSYWDRKMVPLSLGNPHVIIPQIRVVDFQLFLGCSPP